MKIREGGIVFSRSQLATIRRAVMKITSDFQKVEVGFRLGIHGKLTANSLLWKEDADLDRLEKLHWLNAISTTPAQGSAWIIVLDLYIYTGRTEESFDLSNRDCTIYPDGGFEIRDQINGLVLTKGKL